MNNKVAAVKLILFILAVIYITNAISAMSITQSIIEFREMMSITAKDFAIYMAVSPVIASANVIHV